ncbi:HDOD domain-containing protein [Vreelandella utahensis]|uniref:HDOD domain-containing protein n=1 Tax=Vreelandella halophila TaxID=86177 RepID=UPI000987715D|nr:HDOD domain-containing protein [Halomonas utahensis]
MTTPRHLETFFRTEEGGLAPESLSSRDSAGEPRIRTAVLADALGRVQAFFREDSLLDIDRLNQALARELRGLPLRDMGRLRQKYQVRQIPPLPAMTHFETAVDNRVAELQQARFYSGQGEEDLSLGMDDYRRLLESVRWLAISRPLTDIAVNYLSPEQDETQLRQALHSFTGLRIKQRLDDTLEIPPLPETAQKILHLRMKPNAEIGDLADIVENDPSLAAQVVSWASSSFYASHTPVNSIYDAIQRVLGFDLVMNLAMGLSLGRTLKQPTDQPEGFIGYWTQAIWMAQAVSVIISCMPRRERPTFGLTYLAGLLHNFGYLVLAHVFPPHFSLICRYTEVNTHVPHELVEHHLIGITREQIGGVLMDLWNMPEEVVAAIRHQKNPKYAGEHSAYANALYLARALLVERGVRLGPELAVPDALYERLNLAPGRVAEEMDILVENSDSVASMAGMLS